MADGNAKLFIEAQVIDNFKAIASKIRSGIEKIDTSVKIEIDDNQAKAQIENALSNIGRILGDTNGMAQYLDLSGIIPQVLATLQSQAPTSVKQNAIKDFESSLEAFESLTKNFGLNGNQAVSVIQELNESLGASGMKKYLEDLQSVYSFIKNIQGLSKKNKDSLFRSLTDSIKTGASSNNLADAIGLKNIDEDFKDVDQFAFSAKEARLRLIEELEKWNELKEGSKIATKRGDVIAGLISRIESLSGKEFKDYLNSKLADDRTSGDTKAQVQKLFSLYTQKGGWGEHFVQWMDSDNKAVNKRLDEMKGVTDRVREMTKRQMEEREKILANTSQISSTSLSQNNQASNSIIYSGEEEINQELSKESEYRKELADKIEQEVQELKAKLNILREIAGLEKEVIKSGVESTPEYAEMQFLETAVDEVTEAVNNKTDAFIREEGIVKGTVQTELEELGKLKNKLDEITNFGDEDNAKNREKALSKSRKKVEELTEEQQKQAKANAALVQSQSILGEVREKQEKDNSDSESKPKAGVRLRNKNLPNVGTGSNKKNSDATTNEREAQALKDIADYSQKATEGLQKFGDVNDKIIQSVTGVAETLKKEASALTSMSKTFLKFDDSKIVQQARKEKLQEDLSEVYNKMKLSEKDTKSFQDSFMATIFDKDHLEDAAAQLRNAYKDVVSFREVYSQDTSKESMFEMAKREAKLWSSYKEAEKQGILESNLEAKRFSPSLLGITQEKNSDNLKLLMQELNQRKQVYEDYAKEAESIQNEIEQVENPPASKQLEKSDKAIKQYQEVISTIKEYIEAQKELIEIQKSTGSEPAETKFNAEQLEQFSTALSNISDSLTKIQTAFESFEKTVDFSKVIEQLETLNNIFSNFIGDISFDDFKDIFTVTIDEAADKINEFKSALDIDNASNKFKEQISQMEQKIEELQSQLNEKVSTETKPVEAAFNPEQLELFQTTLGQIRDSLISIQTALGALDDKSDVPSIIKSINEMIEVFKKLGTLIDDINNKKIKFGFSSNPDEKLIGEMNSEEVKQSLTGLFDDAIKKIQDFKTNVDMSETVKKFKSQISEMEKAVKKLEEALEKEKKARENDKAVVKAKEEKRILEETRKAEEKARQEALAKEKAEQEQRQKEEFLKSQEARNKVFKQGYSAQLDQQKKEEKIAQKQFQTALEQSRLQEQANNFNVNKEITSKYNRELALDQGRQFQLDEQIKKAEQAKKLTQTELEQNRLSAQIEQVQKERSLKIKKTLEQNKESQLDEQIKKAEQAKKITQIELEQARLAGQYDQASVMRQKKEQEQLKKEQDIKEYEKQFNNWNEEENGQLTFLDKNTHDLTEEYKKAVQEEIVHAQEVAEREAKSNPINIPLEGQISFTSNEDIDQIMEIYSDKGRQQAEKQFAKMRRSNEYINSETNIEKYLKPYETIEPTKYISELADVSSKIQDVKAELESSFDSEEKMVGNPLRIQELFKQYDALVLRVKELKAIISSPTSQENIALELAKKAENAKEKVKETKEELDELKNKITSTFDVGRSDEIFTSKTEAFIKSYGSLSDKNNINTLIAPIEGSGFEEQQSKVIALREELKKYKEAVEELKQLKNSDIVDLNTLTEADKKVKDLETSINAMMKSIRASGTSNASTSQVDKFARQIEAFMIKNPRITLEAKNSLNEYLQTLKSGESISKTALGAMADGFAKLKIEQEQAGKLGYNIWDQMVLKMREGVAFLATKFSFYQIFNQFRQGITIVKEFDDALTEMQKVSDETMLTLQRYQKTTFDVAESIGSTALQVQQSTADFLRLGESLEEAAKSAKAANVLMNVSEFESINDATTSLIALSAAYNDLTKENIIDKLNEVGNNYSISTSGAAEALQMSASALKTAQNDMNESLALVTAGNQVVQDISKAGNGLRTIALRLTGTKSAKEELEEMGEETENVITTQSKLRDVIKEATAVESNAFKGFDILDDNGNYKSTYEIMLGIAQIYDEIVETDKKLGRNNVNLLLETVAGKTRANVAASIFQSPDVLQKAYASSVSANGSAQEENQKYLESISGHLAQLQSKWQEVWSKTANREIINFFIDLGKGILDVVDKIGLIPSALAVIIPYFELIRTGATNSKGVITILLEALSTLNEVEEASNVIKAESETISLLKAASTQVENEALRQQIEACIEAAVAEEAKNTVGKESTALSLLKKASLEIENEELKEAIANYIQLAEAESLEAGVAGSTKASKGVGLLASRFDLLKKAATGAKTAIVGALGPTGAIIATIGVVLAGAAAAAAVANNHIREEAIANAKEATDTLNKQDESLQKQIASYEELKTKLDSGELSEQETLQTKQQIYDIQKQITEEYGTAAQGVDLVNGKLEKQVALLNSIGQKEALSLYNKNYEGYEAAIDEYTKDRKYGFSLSSGSKVIQDALSEAGLNVYGSGSGTFMAQIKDDAEGSIKSLEKARANLEKLQSEYKDTDTAKIIDNEIKKIDKAIGDAYEDADEYRDEALKGLELRLLSKNQKGFDTYQNYQSSVSNLEDAYISGDTKKIEEARKAFEEATIAKDKFLNIPSNNQFSLLFDNIDTSLIKTKNQIYDATEAVKKAKEINTELDRINNYKEQKKQADALYDSLGNVQKVGNIDNGNRPIIFWDNKELKKQQKAIESWGETIEDFQGSMSTVYGGSGEFDGVEIAFTPIINDGTGKGKLLTKDTLYKYIDALIGKAGEGWTNEELLKLDAEGLTVDGQKISNVLGAVGNSLSGIGLSAAQVGELMHDWQSNTLGYVSEFKQEWQEAIEQGETLEEHMQNRERSLKDTTKATDKYTKQDKKLAKALREVISLDMDRVDAEMVFDDNANASETYSNALYNLMDALGWATDAQGTFIDWAVDVGLIQGTVTDALDAASVSYNDYAQAISTATENLTLLQTVLTESDSGKGLTTATLDQFKTAFGDDAIKALEKTANGIRANRDAVRELGEQQNESLHTTQLQALNDQYTALQKVYEGYENALHNGDPTTPFIQQEEAIRNEINNLELLEAQWRGTTSAYQAWINSQSNSNPQDMYANVVSGYETVEDLIARGWWTDESVRDYLDLVLADDFDAQIAGANELKEGFESLDKTIEGTSFSIHDFFMTDESGNIAVDGLNNFEDALKQIQDKYYPDKNWLTYEDGKAIFDFRNGGNKEVADALGIGTELLDIFISAMESAGGLEVKLDTDDAKENLKQLKEEAIDAKESLDLNEKINLDPSNIKEADESINNINTVIEEIKNNDEIDLEAKTDQLEEANKILEYLIENKNQLIQSSFGEKGIHLIDIGELDAVNNKLKEILNRPVKGGFDFSEFDFDTVEGLTAAQDAINNMVATPNVDDSQIQYLNELLDVITEKLGIINGIGSGASLTLGEYKALDETVTSVKQQIQEGQDAANKGFHISWSSDEDFYNTLDAINNLDPEIKTAFGLIPDKTTEELMDMVENGETIFVETKTTGVTPAPVQDETRTINTQENVTLGVTTVGADAAHSLIQEFEEKNGTESTITLNATSNVSETKQEIEETQQASNELGESQPDVTATLNDKATSPLLALGNLADSIDGKSATIWSFYKDPNDAQGKIRYIAEHVYDRKQTITTEYKTTGSAPKGTGTINGTAHAQGTAFARGSIVSGNAFTGGKWGIPQNQTALTGELGTEIVVRDGNWFTVGEDGAEFVDLQKGDIVFNHKQAQELLENGYVTSNKGRGKLVGFANGSAFYRGTMLSGPAYGGDSAKRTRTTSSVTTKKVGKKTTKKTTTSKGNGGGGNGNGKGNGGGTTNKEANKTKNTLDEVEILIARIERQIANLDKTISSTYKTWSTRNAAIKSDLTKVAKEIKEQSKAYTTYMRKANSIQIATDKNADGSTKSAKDKKKQSDTWKKRIQNGQQIIRDISNQDVWDKIQEYKQWYEKALQSKDAIIDLKEKEGELYKQRFDNEQTYYEERIADIQHYIDLLETYNDTLSESGKLGSKVLIQDQISRETIRLNELNKEYKSLIARRDEAVKSGKIKKYSEAWYEIEEAIHEVDESIAEANNNLVTYANNMRQLDWDRWDKVHDAIGGVNNELEFLYDLFNADDFFDDQGSLTDQGVTAFALLAQQYDTYFREAQEYQKEIEATEELLKADKGKNKYDQNLVDKLKELKESQQDAISNAKKMKDSMVDLTEDGIKKQIDYVKDLIEDYEDLLEAQKDQTDYAKKVADQQKEINKLEKQYRAIQNDTSEEGATKRQKLRDQINEKRQDLKDTQEDRRISETKDMLSDFQENFEDFLNNKLKDVEGVVREVINRTNANGTIINDTITTLANSYGYTPSDTLKNTLTDLSNNLVSYFNSVFDNENVRTIASGVDEIVKYYQEAQNKSETIGQTQSNEAMSKQVKETGSHVQSYTDDSGKVKLGFFNNDGTQNKTYSGWAQKDGKQYLFTNGSVDKKNQWYTGQNGKRYYLNGSGARVTGIQTIKGKTYFFNSDGTKSGNKNGWVTSGSKKYYFKNGAAVTGWYTINKKRYYFGTDGKMYKGLKTIGNKKYYFDSNGVLLKGIWRKINNKQYYLDKKDGHVLTGKQTIDGKKYTFNTDGSFKKNGWKKGTASVPKTGMAWTNEGYKTEAIIRKSDGAILTPLNRGDSVIPNSAMKNMYRALTDPEKYLKQYTTPDVRIVQGNGSTNNQSPTINMQFIANGVQDANKFANELMNNKKLEKWIQEVTLGQANGHNSFRKYSYAIR